MTKGKKQVVSDTAAISTVVTTPKRKRADKEKFEIVVKERRRSLTNLQHLEPELLKSELLGMLLLLCLIRKRFPRNQE
ncbi:hypothetical protein A2U01_0087306, partial [Trifolium medium]|nr:hypothetical protein [Trifolium medium]